MKHTVKSFALLSLTLTLTLCFAKTTAHNNSTDYSDTQIAQLLGWVDDKKVNNLCQGYYRQDLPVASKNYKGIHYRAHSSQLNEKGDTQLQGNVVINQGQRTVHADSAVLIRDHDNKAHRLTLKGNIKVEEPGVLVYARRISIELAQKAWQIWHVLYRLALNVRELSSSQLDNSKKLTAQSAWGQASRIEQKKAKLWVLHNASYTTCKPNCHVWHLAASKITLNKKDNVGSAHNVKLYVRGVPIFWWPYLTFPLSNKRQSGFLMPGYGTSSSMGFNVSLPIYWNIAPNYDLIFTPVITGKRGIIFKNYFRYLSANSSSSIQFNFTPNDNAFKQTKKDLIKQYSGKPQHAQQVNALQKDTPKRYFLNIKDKSQLNKHLFAKLNYATVSDDYYVEDYLDNDNNDYSTANQINQQLQVNYFEKKWRLNVDLQRYQTLHPLDQADIENQYARLPQITFDGTAGYHPYNVQFALNASFTDFTKARNPFDVNLPDPTVGQRLNLDPTVTRSFSNSFFFVTPSLQMDLTSYHLKRPNPGAPDDPSRAVPIFSIDSGMYFDKNLKLFGTPYIETLEPHIYYLYVPYRNQNNLPLFDTVDNSLPLSFDYDQMFVDNRFSDIDRIGDTNQVTLALTSQLRDTNTGMIKAYASIGQIYYFRNRRVLACTQSKLNNPTNPLCPQVAPKENLQALSPLASQFLYNISKNWNISGNLVYNAKRNRIDNQTYSLSFQRDPRHIINLSYSYARGIDDIDSYQPLTSKQAINQTGLSTYWPISKHWSGIGVVNYSFNRHRFQSYIYGVEYQSCCWGFRAIINRAFIGLNPAFNNDYDNRFFLQFSLNGLTSLGTSDPSSLLDSNIENYKDQFGPQF